MKTFDEEIEHAYRKAYLNGIDGSKDMERWVQSLKEAVEMHIIGVNEDLNAPLDRNIEGNPESDTDPELYIVRRATRNMHRIDQLQALWGKEGEEKL